MDDWWSTRTRLWSAIAVAAGLGLSVGLEVLEEPDSTPLELMLEMLKSVSVVVACVGTALLFHVTRRQRADHLALARGLAAARQQGERWRADSRLLLNGLGEAIDRQFRAWSLTDAERQVALLLLKGLSSKEIALVRQSSERTVREQARAVYAKAGLSGRAALSAYFLEDLLAPPAEGPR